MPSFRKLEAAEVAQDSFMWEHEKEIPGIIEGIGPSYKLFPQYMDDLVAGWSMEGIPDGPEADQLSSWFRQGVEMTVSAQPNSLQQYMGLAVLEGIQGLRDGEFGVGAVYVIRHKGVEMVYLGRDLRFNDHRSVRHAEQEVVRKVEVGDLPDILGGAPHMGTEVFMATSLEPCAMCLGTVLTHNYRYKNSQTSLGTIVIGAEDPDGGQMLGERWRNLPKDWQQKYEAQQMTGMIPDIDPAYAQLPWRIAKEGVDVLRYMRALSNSPVYDPLDSTLGKVWKQG